MRVECEVQISNLNYKALTVAALCTLHSALNRCTCFLSVIMVAIQVFSRNTKPVGRADQSQLGGNNVPHMRFMWKRPHGGEQCKPRPQQDQTSIPSEPANRQDQGGRGCEKGYCLHALYPYWQIREGSVKKVWCLKFRVWSFFKSGPGHWN